MTTKQSIKKALKQATCPTLSQSGTIGYEFTVDDNEIVSIGLTSNSGSGYFSKAKQPVNDVISALEQFQTKYPITSLALKDLYPGTSINSWSFLMAALLEEGLVEDHPDHLRRYRLADTDAFLASIDQLKAKQKSPAIHTPTRKRKAKAAA